VLDEPTAALDLGHQVLLVTPCGSVRGGPRARSWSWHDWRWPGPLRSPGAAARGPAAREGGTAGSLRPEVLGEAYGTQVDVVPDPATGSRSSPGASPRWGSLQYRVTPAMRSWSNPWPFRRRPSTICAPPFSVRSPPRPNPPQIVVASQVAPPQRHHLADQKLQSAGPRCLTFCRSTDRPCSRRRVPVLVVPRRFPPCWSAGRWDGAGGDVLQHCCVAKLPRLTRSPRPGRTCARARREWRIGSTWSRRLPK